MTGIRNSSKKPLQPVTAQHRFGLLFACELGADGHQRTLGWSDLNNPPAATQANHFQWIHLDLRHSYAHRWLKGQCGIDPLFIETMSACQVQPQLLRHNAQLLLILKGVNFVPGSPPGDLVSLRIVCDGQRLISCRREPVTAINALRQRILAGQSTYTPGALITQLAEILVDPMDAVVMDLLDRTHAIGHASDRDNTENLVAALAHLRRGMIRIHSHLNRQRRVFAKLGNARLPWLKDPEQRAIRALATTLNEHLSSLAAAQEITEITQDEILQRSSERTERRLFSLTVITAIFLPLTFITGLLGVNLAGIPDANDPLSFFILCLLLGGIVGLQLWYLRRKHWL